MSMLRNLYFSYSSESNIPDASLSSEAISPRSLVTEDCVQAALTADKGAIARLISWKIVDFTKTNQNYLCIVTSVDVKYELDGRSSQLVYVVKLKPFRGPEERDNEVFRKEATVYLILIPQMNSISKRIGHRELNFSKCLHANLEKRK